MSDLIKSSNKTRPKLKAEFNWNKASLRQCLKAFGFSDADMRYRVGGMHVLDSWTCEETMLLNIVTKRWKELVKMYHEASNNGNKELWTISNSIYTAIRKKINQHIKFHYLIPQKNAMYSCMFCHKSVSRQSHRDLKYKVCSDNNCQRLRNNLKSRIYIKQSKTRHN